MLDQRNLLVAIVLSIGILLGFQLFVEGPRQAEQQVVDQAAEQIEGTGQSIEGLPPSAVTVTPETDPATLAQELLAGAATRDEAVASSERIRIETPRLAGSISTIGAQIDDLTLLDYQVSVEDDSPQVVLLSPRGAPDPYFADFGWTGAAAVPNSQTEWTADRELLTPETPVTLSWDNGEGLLFEQVLEVDENFMFTVTQRVTNASEETAPLRPYGRVGRYYTPDQLGFFILHEGPYGVFNGTLDEYGYDDLIDGAISETTTGGWLGFTDKYWLVALVPDQDTAVDAQFAHTRPGTNDRYFASFVAEPIAVEPGATVERTSRVFAGAKEVHLIEAYESALGIDNFELTVDFGWFYFLTKPFFYALTWLNSLVGNFGVAIILFTFIIKLVLFPLANKSYKSMSRMKALTPQMTAIRERYKDDRQRMNMEVMQLYKREKVNPASGCLPIIVQIPIFFALYKVLFVTIEMRHAPFFGWIQDLSAPDPTSIWNLFGLIPWEPAAYLPPFLMLGIWPIIMGFTMWAQMKLNPAPTDPIQARVMMFMPVVFTFLLATFPAGLVIYWTTNNALSILQQYVIMRRMGVKVGGGSDPAPTPLPPSAKRRRADKQSDAKVGNGKTAAANHADASAVTVGSPETGSQEEKSREATKPMPPQPGGTTAPPPRKSAARAQGRRRQSRRRRS